MLENTIKLNAREFRMPVKPVERDIVAVLAKVKKQVRFQVSDFQIASTVTHRDKRRTYSAATSLSLSSSSIFCIFYGPGLSILLMVSLSALFFR